MDRPAQAAPSSTPVIEKQKHSQDLEPIANLSLERLASATATILPFLGLVCAAIFLWGGLLRWHDLVVFAVMYIPIGFGVTVGFHRLFTHRSFKCGPLIRGLFGALGSAALEGPVITWVATHRRHHAHSDRAGDPHSPHISGEGEHPGTLRGLLHAHLGWVFSAREKAAGARYAPDLLKDPVSRFIDRTTLVWVFLGLALPFGLGFLLSGSIWGALSGLLWGGLVRIFVLHHVTYSINSLCHFFGSRRFETSDESRNLAWLAPLSMGEAWHNNHHAFPTSAAHGMKWYEIDPSAILIRTLARLGLVWDVVEIPGSRLATKAI